MSTQKTLLGFLGGLAAGAAIGILFAPQSGKKTRRAIARRAGRGRDEISDLIEQGHEQWSKVRNKAADAATMTKDEVEDFVRYLFKEGRDLKDRVTDDVKRTASDVAANGGRRAEEVRKSATN